jgi:succinoglycan biosynthesis transport protein ExoP
MTHRDDEHAPAPNPSHAMVGTRAQDALVPHTNGVAPAHIYQMAPAAPTQDVLRGGMDANSFINCLRRRWLLAACMGLVAAGAVATGVYLAFPETSSATALFNVSSHKPTLLENDNGQAVREFEILQRTQLAYLKSPYVIQAAIRDPAIASLSFLAGEREPVQFLIENMNSAFPQNSEILSLSLSGDTGMSEDLRKIVDAVSKAYLDEVVLAEDQRRSIIRDALAKSSQKLNDEITQKMEQHNSLAKELGVVTQSGQRDPESQILLHDITELNKARAGSEAELAEMQTNYMILEQRLKDPRVVDAILEEKLASDPTYLQMQQELSYLQMQSQSSSAMKNGRSRQGDRIQREIQAKQQQIAQYKQAMSSGSQGGAKDGPAQDLQMARKEFQIRATVLAQSINNMKKLIEEKTEKLMKKGEESVDLEVRASELNQLQQIASDMSIKLERLNVESIAPARIRQIQPATVQANINWVTRWLLSGSSGAIAFALTCFGIAYLEFRNRRLDGPEQVGEGLGIRVVGTLPSLAGRAMLDPDHPVVAQLTESIDSVRTQLMHDSTSKRRQVVLITSAATMEGRTTVASQLAASLARAGRRTLLVDGDVRRPVLHTLFDVPLEDGLCEVLRAEVDVADVIRPTHAEGLWLLTAGYCDIDAIHALATEQMQPVFEKLRGEYDFIIIDGAPVLGMSDALIFGQYSDGAILSVRRDFSQMPKINEAAALLQSVGIRLVGAVVNGVPTKSDDRVTQLRLIAPKSERQLQSA